ncbi:unnamed protein product [Clonostachys chloroleuca]|uniref:Gfo/Idh/MocA-like oxidoreductase N-terminal domain-containing protein n=1 Tax=Clonostachys chloroleuca TaxID=1926264 RepID=A0AA35MD68_9HYPO|nr:unnamed protein product [Clonostachys chloroleuca]
MAPIRIGIVGLSASAKTSWAANAHLPYLLSPRGQSHYKIVALLNSSVEAAKKSIKHFNLPPETKAYGDPQALADDGDVDLVVVNTRVDVHHQTALPSAKAGKNVYVEWPLAQDAKHVDELVQAARQGGGRTLVGLQGRVAPPVEKLRELIQSGRIGKVLNSEVVAAGGLNDRERAPQSLKYFLQRSVGGNVYTIGFGHLFDQIQHVLGDFTNIESHLQIQRPEVKLFDPASKNVVETVQSDVPDLIYAIATLPESESTQAGASALLRFRRGQTFKGDPALVWTIQGTKGEIRLTARDGTTLHASAYSGPVTIQVYDFATDTVEDVSWKWADWQEELPILARSVGEVYERFASENGSQLASFEEAGVRHKQLNKLLVAFDHQ